MKSKITNKKIILPAIVILLSIILIFSAVIKETTKPKLKEPEIKSIFELATIKAYYHNVAKGKKTAGSKITDLGEKDRVYWIEYTGYVNLGIDMKKVDINFNRNKVVITIPNVEILDSGIYRDDKETIETIHSSDSWFNKNKITPEDEGKTLEKGQQKMIEQVKNNEELLLTAEKRAKELIENYIKQLKGNTNKEYEIEWRKK